jgi:hypothetical protein
VRRDEAVQGELTIRLEGVFDIAAARRVQDELARAQPGVRVRLDFPHIREFHDFGVAALAQALGEGGALVVGLRGLRDHQVRLLRYLGAGALAPPLAPVESF